MDKNFNIIIAGTGGQGLITLLQIIAEAATIEGFDVKTSELHGLSQRGGSVETHIRFGKKIYSPLVQAGEADLILSLEMSEILKVINYSGPGTVFLANRYIISYQGGLSEKEIIEKINTFAKGEKYFVPAFGICQKELGNEIVSGIYLLGFASFKKLIPLKEESFLKAVSKIVPERYLELNIKAFELAKSS
jgi:indolepyruvate ferredoxin oxidoreductase beta subunit